MFRMLRGHTFYLALSLAVPGSMAPLAFAQSVGASLTGQVTDPSGAAIPGATVTATNLGTGLKVTATSSDQGSYRIAPLPPGAYSLSVQVSGFETYLQQGITINVDTPATQNVSLKTGNVQETVTVTADAELLNTTNGSLGQTIDATAVTQLPLNGRSPASLVLLAPGMTPGGNTYSQTGFSFPSSSEPSVSANGGTQGSTYFLLDGVPNMDTYLGLPAPFPNADATQEFRVITNNFNAVYGFAPGAVVTIQTRSGTNDIHGGAFDFYRDQVFNAKNYFSHGVDPLHQNQFGGFAGGPILKNRAFIFANYQGTRNATASTELNSYVPTAAMLGGDLSGISTPLCTNGAPSATCPFGTLNGKPNQLLPGYSLNATAVAVDKATLPVGQQANGLTYYNSPAFINQIDEGTAKLDLDITPKQRVSLRSFITSFVQPSANVDGNLLALNNNYNYDVAIQERYYNETLGDVWTLNDKMVNSLSVFWSEYDAGNGSQANQADGTPFCWSKYINVTELPGQCYVEGFSVGGNGFNVGYYEPSTEARSTYGIYDQLTIALGKQTLTFGTNVQHQYAREQTQYPTSPILSFGGQYTGSGLADFLAGDLTSMTQGAGEIANVAGWQPGFFGQEEFRAQPNLTLSAGLRWDPNLPPTIAGGRASTFIPGQQSIVYPNAPLGVVFPGDPNVGAGLMRTTYGYWEPRLGVAWQPKNMPHTAIHAGFGLFTSPMIYSDYNHTADNAPFAPTFDLQGTNTAPLSLDNPWASSPGTGGVSPFPPFAATGLKPASTALFPVGVSIPATIDPAFKLATTASWNLTVEQQFGQNTVARVAYVGTQTYHAPFIIDRNPGIYVPATAATPTTPAAAASGARSTYPALSEILDMESHGTASYHALQVSVERRLNHNLQFQGNFTYAKTMDLASSANVSFGTNQLTNPFNLAYNYGASSENVPLRAVGNITYTVPTPLRMNPALRQVLGGWEISVITTAQSGFPFTVGGGLGNNNSYSQQYEDRADVVPGVPRDVRQGGKANWLSHYFNTAAFTQNAIGTFGSSGKNIMHAPSLDYSDAGLFKNFKYRERYDLQFRWEMFNVLNQPSFAAPDSGNGDSNEGAITATGAEPSRVGQMALKLTF
ncbi:carboxypeptidase-like regulatory domain-containing protein [Acidipila sp. EB88]|uniref:carboxypeptidase-like regulatory domain-containing protein n=1 Tax=Acidipila sp. EB88 TaxID=2305226 RepID=UPI000F5D7445|nr:carboxypeptidase-like regulatory domain-containing protein [Acidipila sp. EB88]RRA49133.1 carboxypeptidase regulatory-like domain-containing protein [Acidipila sp. EB88]